MAFGGRTSLLAVAALSALSLTACGGGDSSGGDSKTVTIWSSIDQPVQDGLSAQLTEEAKKEGITIDWQRVDDINSVIMTKLQAGDAPDIALIPQPGVVKDIVARGAAQPLDDAVDMSALQSSMVPGTLDAGTVDGKLYGLLVSMNVKSLVFYNKPAWDKAGYQAPDSMQGLEQLTDQIKSDGGTPWCFGIGSEAATGWPATDWMEDMVMRVDGPDVYNQWVAHEIPFNDPKILAAGEEMSKLLFTDGNIPGGMKAAASTAFGDAGKPMFDPSGPKCWMLKQGSFIVSPDFLGKAPTQDVDKSIGLFGLPPETAGGENPVLGGGDMATLLSDSASAKEVIKLMSEANFGEQAAGSSSFLSPHKDFDASLYPNDLTRSVADVAYKSTQFLFDGSDQMPGAVGAGTFWTEMTNWISGSEDLKTALDNIEQSWPAS